MAVKLVLKLNKSQIRKIIKERKQRVEDAILLRLQFIGEQFVINAGITQTLKITPVTCGHLSDM